MIRFASLSLLVLSLVACGSEPEVFVASLTCAARSDGSARIVTLEAVGAGSGAVGNVMFLGSPTCTMDGTYVGYPDGVSKASCTNWTRSGVGNCVRGGNQDEFNSIRVTFNDITLPSPGRLSCVVTLIQEDSEGEAVQRGGTAEGYGRAQRTLECDVK